MSKIDVKGAIGLLLIILLGALFAWGIIYHPPTQEPPGGRVPTVEVLA